MEFPPRIAFDTVGAVHAWWGWVAIVALGLIGIVGLVLAFRGREPGRGFWWAAGLAIGATLVQVGMGLWAFAVEGTSPGNQHLFYGVVISFTLAFAYIYRGQLGRRPALSYGLLLLFMMGLGLRGVMTFGQDFGG